MSSTEPPPKRPRTSQEPNSDFASLVHAEQLSSVYEVMRHQVTYTVDRCINDLQEKNAFHAKHRRPTDFSAEATKIFERKLADERARRKKKKLSEQIPKSFVQKAWNEAKVKAAERACQEQWYAHIDLPPRVELVAKLLAVIPAPVAVDKEAFAKAKEEHVRSLCAQFPDSPPVA